MALKLARKGRDGDRREYESLFEKWDEESSIVGDETDFSRHELARHTMEMMWRFLGDKALWAQSHIAGYAILREHPTLVDIINQILDTTLHQDSEIIECLGQIPAINRPEPTDGEYDVEDELVRCISIYAEHLGVEPDEGGGWSSREALFDKVLLTPQTLQRIVVELLLSRDANTSFWRMPLQHSLRALSFGQVTGIAEPAPGKRQGRPYQLQVWKCKAIQKVSFLCGKGFKKYAALSEVAGSIGQEDETLRTWEKALKTDDFFGHEIYYAGLAGRYSKEISASPRDFVDQVEFIVGFLGMDGHDWVISAHREMEKLDLTLVAEKIRQFRDKAE